MSKTVSGELITIDDSAYDGFRGMTVYGNTVQNLWVNPNGTFTQNGMTITPNSDGSVTINGTSTSSNLIVFKRSYALKPGAQYTVSVDKLFPMSGSKNSGGFYIQRNISGQLSVTIAYLTSVSAGTITFSVPAGTVSVTFGIQVIAGATVSGTYRVMLNEGSEAEPWCPPGLNSVGDDGSVKVVTAGKNLWVNPSGTQNGITVASNGDGSFTVGGTATNTAIIRVRTYALKPAGEYTLSIDKSVSSVSGCGVSVEWYKDNTPVSNILIGYGSTLSGTFTIPGSTEYCMLRFRVTAGTTVSGTYRVMLNEGSTATAYEPPNITTTPIDLQGHTLNALPDGTRDELRIDGGGNVVLEKRCGDRVVDGTSLAVMKFSNDGKEARINVGDSYFVSSSGDDTDKILSDKLPPYDPDVLWNAKPLNGCSIGANGQIAARCNDMSDKSAFNQFFQQNNMRVVYKLAEPQTIDLGKIDLPKLRKKPLVNTVWANGSAKTTNFYLDTEMELTYLQWPGVRADGFKVSGKHNFWDFSSCVASSDSGKPEKKFVTATVPYMSGFYDLSKIYGAIAYESRDVSYTFELLGDDMEDLQRQKTNLLDWLGLVHDEPIYDDTQPNYHYVGSFYEADWEEDETGESGTLTVTFKCQPFLIADRATEESLSVGTHTVVNHGQQVSVFAKANSGSATVKINGVIQAVTTTEQRLTAQLQPGENEVVVTSNSVTLRYFERHL